MLIASRFGKAIRFNVEEVRLFRGRNSVGVSRGMRLKDGDEAVSICVIRDPEREYVLSVTENGFGKRTAVSEYRCKAAAGRGLPILRPLRGNGQVVASFTVFAEDHLMMVTNAGKVIRIRVDGGEGDTIRIAGRKTQGVTLFEIDKKELVVSVGIIRDVDEDETDETDDAHDDAGVEQAETPKQMRRLQICQKMHLKMIR